MTRLRYAILTGSAIALAATTAGAQGNRVNIPPGQMPLAGLCRVWIDGVPAGRQPRATDCATAQRTAPANSHVIFGGQGRNNLDTRTGVVNGRHDPRADPRSPQYDPRFDPNSRVYGSNDPRYPGNQNGTYDPRYPDNRNGTYDPRFPNRNDGRIDGRMSEKEREKFEKRREKELRKMNKHGDDDEDDDRGDDGNREHGNRGRDNGRGHGKGHGHGDHDDQDR